MTAVQDAVHQARQLRELARNVRLQAQDARAHARMMVAAAAAAEDQFAAVIGRPAEREPGRAEHLQGISESARRSAARKRARLVLADGGTCPCDQGDAPASSQPPPVPDSTPGAAASTKTPDPANDLSITGERDRIAAQLQDTVIRRVFAAGLSLESAAGLIRDPQVRRRIETAVDELDQVIREIRNAVFQDVGHSHQRRLTRLIPDLGGQLATTATVTFSGPADGAIPAGDTARLLVVLRQILGLIGEHATPASVDIAADTSSYSLTIDAATLSPGTPTGEPASWLSSIQAAAAQSGVSVAFQPTPDGMRFTCRLPMTPPQRLPSE
jgi:Histidine kinase